MRLFLTRSSTTLLTALLLASCQPEGATSSTTPVGTSSAPRTSDTTTQDTSTFPAMWRHAELETHRKVVAAQTELDKLAKDAVGAEGPVLHELVKGRKVLTMTEYDSLRTSDDIPEGQVGEELEVHSLAFRRAPWAAIDPRGNLKLSWDTLLPARATSVYFGTRLPDDDLAIERYRKHTRDVTSDAKRLHHEVSYPLHRIVGAKYDVAGARMNGRGEVAFRLEVVDETHATTRLHDDRVSFRCSPVPCGDNAAYVQLPTVTMGPFVDKVTTKSATISWTTDVPTMGYVLIRGETGKERLIPGDQPGRRHEIEVLGLHPDEKYRYHVMAVDHRGEVGEGHQGTLRAAPPKGQPFAFAVMSDSRSGNDVGEASYGGVNRQVLVDLLGRAHENGARLIVFAGDLIDGYTTVPSAYRMELRAWQRSAEYVGRHLPIYEGVGNHEALIEAWTSGWAIDRREGANTESVFAELFVNPDNGPMPTKDGDPPYKENVYSFFVGDAHFAVLNSNYRYRSHYDRKDHPAGSAGYREGAVTDEQLQWLDRDLDGARKRGAEHLFVFTHEPSFPNGGHVEDGMYWNGKVEDMNNRRTRFWRTLVKYEALAAFFGDEHNYSRTLVDNGVDPSFSVPVWSIISGGAGAPYYAQDWDVPWARNVRKFSARQHFVLVRIEGDRVTARTIDRAGQEIDRFVMTDRR